MEIEAVIKEFMQTIIANEMRNCKEHFSSYHLEGDVLAHTMMVVKESLELYPNDNIMFLSALFHDIGKPMSMFYDEEKGKYYFRGHEGISTHLMLDFIKSLKEKRTLDISDEELVKILYIVNMHGYFWQKSYNQFKELFKYNYEIYKELFRFHFADVYGRITEKPQEIVKSEIPQYYMEKHEFNQKTSKISDNNREIIILVGLPAVGKDTYIKKNFDLNEYEIIGFDKIVEEYGDNEKLTYTEAYKKLKENQDLYKIAKQEVSKRFSEAIKKKRNIIVNMTNMNWKTRKSWYNRHGYNYKIIVFLEPLSEIYERNEFRSKDGKFIPKSAYVNFMKKTELPLYGEYDGIAEIKIISSLLKSEYNVIKEED